MSNWYDVTVSQKDDRRPPAIRIRPARAAKMVSTSADFPVVALECIG